MGADTIDLKGNLKNEVQALKTAKYATNPNYYIDLIKLSNGKTMTESLKRARQYYGY